MQPKIAQNVLWFKVNQLRVKKKKKPHVKMGTSSHSLGPGLFYSQTEQLHFVLTFFSQSREHA